MLSQTQPVETQPLSVKKGRVLNIVLWVLQVLLALAYLSAGYQKAFLPLDTVVKTIFWVSEVPTALVRFIGSVEILGGVGLILPALLRIKPQLTVFAGLGLTTIMTLALIFHILHAEWVALFPATVLLLLAGFVTYGRWKLAQITAR